MTEEARARNGYAASKDPEYGDPWLLRFTNGQSTKIADFHYHDDCEFVARALNDHFEPRQRESWSALRIELQDANARIAALEAELASLRQIVADVETCRGVGVENGVTICGDAEIAIVTLTWPALHDDRGFESSTWQAALHAAAEQVRHEAQGPSESSSNP